MRRRALLLTAALGGCSILPVRPYAEQRDWPLDAERPVTLPLRPRGPVLTIRTVRAGPGMAAQGLQTIEADGSVRSDYYERWSVPPAEAVEAALRRWLAGSGLFAGVLPPGSRAHADLSLEAELLTLIADPVDRPGTPGQSRAALGIVLVDLRPAQSRLLLQAEATGAAPLPGMDPAQRAQSGRQAVAALLGDVELRLAVVVR